jgi:hypothetical protein
MNRSVRIAVEIAWWKPVVEKSVPRARERKTFNDLLESNPCSFKIPNFNVMCAY